MALPVTITGISTLTAPVGPFKVTTQVADQTTALDQIGASLAAPTNLLLGQTFTAATSYSLAAIGIQLTSSPAGTYTNCKVEIRSGSVTGTILGTSDLTTLSNFGSGLAQFVFSTPVALTASTVYAYVLYIPSSTGATINIRGNNTDSYAGGVAYGPINGTNPASLSTRTSPYDYLTYFFKAQDAYYFFGRDATTAGTLQAYKSTAPDTSWATIANRTTGGASIGYLSAYQVGNTIHILGVYDAGGSAAGQYFTFDMSTDAFVVVNEIVPGFGATNGQLGTVQLAGSIVVRSTGEPVVFFNGLQTKTSGTFRARVYYTRRTGTNTWSAAVQVDANGAYDTSQPEALLGASDRVHFNFKANTGAAFRERSISNANALDTEATNAPTNSGSLSPNGVSYVRGAATNVIVQMGSAAIRYASGATPTLSSTGAIDPGGNTALARIMNDGTTAYALSVSVTNNDVYVNSSTDDGANWSTAVVALAATVTSAAANLSMDGNIYQRGTAFVIPYLVNDNGTLKYNEYVVRYVATADAWDINTASSNITLSNSDKTATSSSATTGGVYSSTSWVNFSDPNKYYAEFLIGSTPPEGVGIHPAVSGSILTGSSAMYVRRSDGAIVINTSTGLGYFIGGGAIVAGDVISFAWKPATEEGWVRRNNGFWNNNSSADPSAGTGPFPLSIMPTEACKLWMVSTASGSSATIRTELADFTLQGPSGFKSWMGESITAADGWNVDDAYLASGLILSNGDKTVLQADVTQIRIRSTKTYPASGTAKLYAEVKVDALSVNATRIGIHDTTTAINSSLFGSGTKSFHYAANGFMGLDGSTVVSGAATFNDPDVVCIAWDTVNKRGWVRVNSGIWNNSATANPATNTEGFDLSAWTATSAIAAYVFSQSDQVTIRTKAADLTVANKPSGFTSWMGETLGPANFTLTCGTGTVVISGQATTLRYPRTMIASQGTIAISGQPTILSRGRKMPADVGTIAISGKATGLLATRKMPVTRGTITIDGKPTGLQYGRKLVTTPGTVRIDGKPALFPLVRRMLSSPGTIRIDGKDVTLTYTPLGLANPKMTAETGTIAISGKPAILRFGHVLTATLGTLTVAGQVNILKLDRRIIAGQGTVAISGRPTILAYGRKMPVTFGTIAMSGWPTALRFDHKLVVTPGGLLIAGKPTIVAYGRKMPVTYGNVVITGNPVGLKWSASGQTIMPVTVGSVNISGFPAGSRRTYAMKVTPGTVAMAGQPVILRFAHKLVVTFGTIAMSGRATILSRARKMPVTNGTIAMSGRPNLLTYARKMIVTTGTVVISGKATGLIWTQSGKAKIWDGTTWTKKPTKVWTGTAWVPKPMKVWNGSAWV